MDYDNDLESRFQRCEKTTPDPEISNFQAAREKLALIVAVNVEPPANSCSAMRVWGGSKLRVLRGGGESMLGQWQVVLGEQYTCSEAGTKV